MFVSILFLEKPFFKILKHDGFSSFVMLEDLKSQSPYQLHKGSLKHS